MEHLKDSHRQYSSELSHHEILFNAENITARYPTIGIIGGLGPDATVDLMREINDNTRHILGAQKDQDHLRVLIASNAPTPDRTSHINSWLGKSEKAVEDPFFHLVSSYLDLKGQQNQKQKVKYVGIPCNTAHFYVNALQQFMDEDGSGMKIVHMIEAVAKTLRSKHSDIHKVGLLATSGTIDTGLYQGVLEEAGLEVLIPDPDDQAELVMRGIYDEKEGVKAGSIEEPRRKFVKASERLKERGAQAVIEGCTEIPLALSQKDLEGMLVINPTNILARRLIELTASL
jgi:aspartate racemase